MIKKQTSQINEINVGLVIIYVNLNINALRLVLYTWLAKWNQLSSNVNDETEVRAGSFWPTTQLGHEVLIIINFYGYVNNYIVLLCTPILSGFLFPRANLFIGFVSKLSMYTSATRSHLHS